MWQIHFCANCGARATNNGRFCGTCGFNLTSVVPQEPPPPYEYHLAYKQWVMRDEASSETVAYANRVDRNTGPMSSQISKLLEDLFEQRLKYNKT